MDAEQFAQFMGAMATQMSQTNQVLGHLAVSTAQPQPQGASSAIAQAMRSNLKPPPYGEKDKAIDADTWLFQMEQWFETQPMLSEHEKVRLAGLLLHGMAASWYRDMTKRPSSQLPQTFEAFKAEMLSMFMPVNRARMARDQLSTAKQREGEPVEQYTQHMRRLFLAIGTISEDEKVDRFLRGLRPNLRREVYLQEPNDFEAASRIAAKYDALFRSLGRRDVPDSRSFEGSSGAMVEPMDLSGMNMPHNTRNNRGNPRQGSAPPDKMKDECFHCGKKGHWARDCWSKQKQQSGKPPGGSKNARERRQRPPQTR